METMIQPTLNDASELSQHYQLIEHAIEYIEANVQHQPELDEIASAVGLSEYHFQRLFTRWAGISPKRSSLTGRLGAGITSAGAAVERWARGRVTGSTPRDGRAPMVMAAST